ncbi:transcriptional regulator [Enterococcus sp. BWM-S5]|uniref:Transcriptional regulator n=1 Tax=Enterococcus larvae TaxID=2794352 RepID=A0ABS4CIY1_9ENTE|nr:transcriptional regulator [Enterococcus larvae]MBP1046415.1 transcriptional regulator [Enterococcus larvae]
MKKSTFNYIKDILADYPETDEHIRKREEELRYPYRESDLNKGIKGTKASYDNQDNLMITIEQDKRLAGLERNKRAISKVLDDSEEDAKIIIEELYMKKEKYRKRSTMDLIVDLRMVKCGRTKAYELRDLFFEKLAIELELNI